MCWKIDSKKSGKNPDDYHKIAKENIAVFKFGWANNIDNVFQPYFMIDAEYKPNVRNEEIELKYNNFKKLIIIKDILIYNTNKKKLKIFQNY